MTSPTKWALASTLGEERNHLEDFAVGRWPWNVIGNTCNQPHWQKCRNTSSSMSPRSCELISCAAVQAVDIDELEVCHGDYPSGLGPFPDSVPSLVLQYRIRIQNLQVHTLQLHGTIQDLRRTRIRRTRSNNVSTGGQQAYIYISRSHGLIQVRNIFFVEKHQQVTN